MTRFLVGCAFGSLFTLSAVSLGAYVGFQAQQTITTLNPITQVQEWLR